MLVDIIVLIFIAGAAFAGYKKGLVGILVSLVGMVLSIVLAFMLQGTIAEMLYQDTGLGSTIEQSIHKNVTESFQKKIDEKTDNNMFYANMVKSISSEDEISTIAKETTKFILKGISFIAIFVLTFIICYIIQMMLNIVFDLPILSQINKIGGIAVGILKAIIKVWILLAIVSFLAPLPMFSFLDTLIKDTMITNVLYNNNVFVSLIKAGLNL
ncbi:MAG: CvpA family protein [Clostridia bacterium]|nr:CvpA family protein [Clostridia bacterium]